MPLAVRLFKQPVKGAAQFGGAVGLVPAAVRQDDARGIPRDHCVHRRAQFPLVPPGETQPQVARKAVESYSAFRLLLDARRQVDVGVGE